MSKEQNRVIIAAFILVAVVALAWGALAGGIAMHNDDIGWVESCWPNKPAWGAPLGTCWINGQKVLP